MPERGSEAYRKRCRKRALAASFVAVLAAGLFIGPHVKAQSALLNQLLYDIWQQLGGNASGLSANVTTTPGGSASYRVATYANVGYATPTDLACLVNPSASSKTVYVTQFGIAPQATTATIGTWYTVKRSSPDTGGTSAAATVVPLDSADAAATATVLIYSAAPTLGTLVGDLNVDVGSAPATSAAASFFGLNAGNSGTQGESYFDAAATSSLTQPITLHAGESICINFAGASLPSGFTAGYLAEWTEH